MIKKFTCGLCSNHIGTRHSLRKHLKEEHGKTKKITNVLGEKKKMVKQDWWKTGEFR